VLAHPGSAVLTRVASTTATNKEGETMAPRVAHVTMDCTDLEAVARFWAAALDRPIEHGDGATFAYIGAESDPCRLCVMRTPDPKTTKNRAHLDIQVDDRDTDVKRLLKLGAQVIAEYDGWTTLCDVEGNEFCVF